MSANAGETKALSLDRRGGNSAQLLQAVGPVRLSQAVAVREDVAGGVTGRDQDEFVAVALT